MLEVLRDHEERFHLLLPHLFGIPGYLEYFRQRRGEGDFLMLDNSVFELKNAMYSKELLQKAREASVNEIVVPEALRDGPKSIALLGEFFDGLSRTVKNQFQFAAAVQGNSYDEIEAHYRFLSNHKDVDTICIPFNFEFHAGSWRNTPALNEERRQAGFNRFSIIYQLMQCKVWNYKKAHHLLGLYNPSELSCYQLIDVPNIRSNDSSSCFWHSLYGVRFTSGLGLPYRKIESHVDFNVKLEYMSQLNAYRHNSQCIRDFCRGELASQMVLNYVTWLREVSQ
jgi:hypothetical protein